jgi:hypothetical protein
MDERNDWRLGAGKMAGGIDSVLFDKVRQPSFGLRARNLVDGTDDHRTSDSFVLARYIEAIAAECIAR